jgi:hypothetical protein
MKLVTVHTSFSQIEAEIVRSRLEASGFHAVIANDFAALSMDGYALAAGGIIVQVPEDQAEDSRLLIAAAHTPPPTE